MHDDQGVKLYQTKVGVPCPVFKQGLQKQEKNPGRWEIVYDAVDSQGVQVSLGLNDLFVLAIADLKELMAAGFLTLPLAPQHRQAAGLPVAAENNSGSFPQLKNHTAG